MHLTCFRRFQVNWGQINEKSSISSLPKETAKSGDIYYFICYFDLYCIHTYLILSSQFQAQKMEWKEIS